MAHFVGVDVGTGSARAGVFDQHGHLLATAKRGIRLWQDGPDLAEQSSEDIWRSVCACVREAVAISGINKSGIAGIGFDATCSLVVLGPNGRPLAVGKHGKDERNIIVWMDHRASSQATRINAAGHRVLDYVGGSISPEMETPKLLWLKENLPETYVRAWQFFDLADFLTWRATASLERSVCTVTCKWTYLAHEQRWDAQYFRAIGLNDLADDDFRRIGVKIVPAGQTLGQGLTRDAAADFDLPEGVPVGAGLIDAHAGGIGTVGNAATTTMAYVFGTSACTMTSNPEPLFVPGVWGPYYSAMVPGLWLNEGGQSSAGAAIDQAISMHAANAEAQQRAAELGIPVQDLLANLATSKFGSLSEVANLAGSLVVVPEFLGNRAPFARPDARGAIAGLGIERDLDSLTALYVATVLGVGYGLRQIINVSRAKGAVITRISLSGGAGRTPLVRQLLADSTGVQVEVSSQNEPVLLGAAMLGATAAGFFRSLAGAMTAMTGGIELHEPATDHTAAMHARRFAAFETLQRCAHSLVDTEIEGV